MMNESGAAALTLTLSLSTFSSSFLSFSLSCFAFSPFFILILGTYTHKGPASQWKEKKITLLFVLIPHTKWAYNIPFRFFTIFFQLLLNADSATAATTRDAFLWLSAALIGGALAQAEEDVLREIMSPQASSRSAINGCYPSMTHSLLSLCSAWHYTRGVDDKKPRLLLLLCRLLQLSLSPLH